MLQVSFVIVRQCGSLASYERQGVCSGIRARFVSNNVIKIYTNIWKLARVAGRNNL